MSDDVDDAMQGGPPEALAVANETVPLRERFAALRRSHALPAATGQVADKPFFDDLSGGL
jgi:hypothetical protein